MDVAMIAPQKHPGKNYSGPKGTLLLKYTPYLQIMAGKKKEVE